MNTVLIVGAGFGGMACARSLRARLEPRDRILLVDRGLRFVVGAAKTWIMVGRGGADELTRAREDLIPPGVDLIHAEIQSFDPVRRVAHTKSAALTADFAVLATGAEPDLGSVPGLAEAAHTFYTLDGAERLHRALEGFRRGRILLLIPRVPFPCPPGPYEGALLLHDRFHEEGIRADVAIDVWTVEKAPMGTAGPAMGELVRKALESRGIGYHPSKKTVAVDGGRRVVRFEDGSEAAYDLLVAVPPYRAAGFAVEAGLAAPGGWIPVDPRTLEVKTHERLYAIGDLTQVPLPGRYDPAVPLALPKAGVMAAAQGEVVAARIASAIAGTKATAEFDGRGYCFLEVGEGKALRADGSFFDLPHPVMTAGAADETQLGAKKAWVERWLSMA